MSWRRWLWFDIWLSGTILRLAECIPLGRATLPLHEFLRCRVRALLAGVNRELDECEIADPWNLPAGHPKRRRWAWQRTMGNSRAHEDRSTLD